MEIDWASLWETVLQWCTNVGIKIIIALIILFIAFRIINAVGKRIIRNAEHPELSKKAKKQAAKEDKQRKKDEELAEKMAKKREAAATAEEREDLDAKAAKKAQKKEARKERLGREKEKMRLDKTIVKTLTHVGMIALKILVVIMLIAYLGFDISALTALIASLGVAVGLAVDGALSNVAGGVLLLVTRPFRVDDFITACGYDGTVEDIYLCNTKIRTLDNKVVYLPNGTLCSAAIVNYSEKELRRVDLVFSISYADDFEKAKKIILQDVVANHPLILSDPEPFVRVSAHSESSIDLTSRVWVKNADYWTVYFDMIEAVKKAFDEQGIEIPFKQVDVHIKNGD